MSCLFQSLDRLLEIPADTTRQMICDDLMSNQAIIDGLPTHEVLALEGPDYVQHVPDVGRRHSSANPAVCV